MRYFIILLPMLLLGCTGKHNYMTADGALIETTAEMAYLMSVRDVERVRVNSYHAAIAQAQRPEQTVALVAAMFGAPGQRVERPRTWDERALPWVQTLMPLYAGGFGRPSDGGVSIDGTGNSVHVISRNNMAQSYIAPSVSSSSSHEQYDADDGARLTLGTGDMTTTYPPGITVGE